MRHVIHLTGLMIFKWDWLLIDWRTDHRWMIWWFDCWEWELIYSSTIRLILACHIHHSSNVSNYYLSLSVYPTNLQVHPTTQRFASYFVDLSIWVIEHFEIVLQSVTMSHLLKQPTNRTIKRICRLANLQAIIQLSKLSTSRTTPKDGRSWPSSNLSLFHLPHSLPSLLINPYLQWRRHYTDRLARSTLIALFGLFCYSLWHSEIISSCVCPLAVPWSMNRLTYYVADHCFNYCCILYVMLYCCLNIMYVILCCLLRWTFVH